MACSPLSPSPPPPPPGSWTKRRLVQMLMLPQLWATFFMHEGHELGSGLVGKAQGFYISNSEDGNSQTMAFTVMFTSGGYADSLSFFGVHRTAAAELHLAIMGGTGKYVNAKGFAMVKTFPGDQHETDGVETLLQINVFLAY